MASWAAAFTKRNSYLLFVFLFGKKILSIVRKIFVVEKMKEKVPSRPLIRLNQPLHWKRIFFFSLARCNGQW